MFARRLALRRRVIVNLKTGRAVRGVLWTRRGSSLVLKSAELLEAGRNPTAVIGEVVVDAANVDFVQVLPEGLVPAPAPGSAV